MFWSLLISVMVAELTSAVGLKLVGRPIYWQERYPPRTEKDLWGAWGVPNSKSRLIGPCFDVEYNFNSIGARDKERQAQSSKRWIVLGDSFVEGFGIQERERFTNILEERLGWEFANFGSSSDFGPLQYLLVYRLLAKQFEHQGVIVGLLPNNDFTDNDSDWWKMNRNLDQQNRYRPYAILSPDNLSYRIIYGANGDARPRTDFNSAPAPASDTHLGGIERKALQTTRVWAQKLSEVSATFSLLRQLSSVRTERRMASREGYFTTDEREITLAKLVLNDLSREIGGRQKIILIFPTHGDLVERRERIKDYSDQLSLFIGDLRSGGWTVIDTADAISLDDQLGDITLGCNGHWNAATNRRTAEFLLANYRKYFVDAGLH
ncbi:MAG: hypothetical protein P4L87_26745 [Formivibrio sp.]|nr:hypothetical protein [Formivibrio sp.]